MPDGACQPGPYPNPPSRYDERVAAAITAGRPEDIPGLAWTKPDFASPDHKIVRPFDVDRRKRTDGNCVACAMCSNGHPKFLSGAVLWSGDGWLRVIGHKCAKKPEHFGEARYRGMERQQQQEELDAVALDWLQQNVSTFPSLSEAVSEFRSAALFLEEQQKTLFRGVPELAVLLTDAVRRQGGYLTIAQELSTARLAAIAGARGDTHRTALSRFEVVRVGLLRGHNFIIRPQRKRSRQLEGVAKALALVPPGEGEGPILELIGRGEHEVTITAGAVLRAFQRGLQLSEACAEASHFTARDNLEALAAWGVDVRNSVRFSVRQAGKRITFTQADKSRATIAADWPPIPDLAHWRALVAAGGTLEALLSKRGARS